MRARDKVECLDKSAIDNRLNELQSVTGKFVSALKADGQKVTFLIGVFTGLRFSDFTSITESNIKDNSLPIEQQKIGKPVTYCGNIGLRLVDFLGLQNDFIC